MKENTLKIINNKGEEIECDVLFTFDSEETNKSYIAYTDKSKDSEGNTQVFASSYKMKDGKMELGAIETEKEWKVIETIIDTLMSEVKKDN